MLDEYEGLQSHLQALSASMWYSQISRFLTNDMYRIDPNCSRVFSHKSRSPNDTRSPNAALLFPRVLRISSRELHNIWNWTGTSPLFGLYKHFCVSVNGIRDYPQNQKNLFFQTDIIYTSYTTAIVSFDTFLQFYKHLPLGSYAHPGQIPLSQQKTSGHQTNVKYKLKILENTALLIAKFSRLRFPAVSPSFNTTHWLLWTLYINTALIQEIIGK